jgi:hypothetical protein
MNPIPFYSSLEYDLWPVSRAGSPFGERPLQPSRSLKAPRWNELLKAIIPHNSIEQGTAFWENPSASFMLMA